MGPLAGAKAAPAGGGRVTWKYAPLDCPKGDQRHRGPAEGARGDHGSEVAVVDDGEVRGVHAAEGHGGSVGEELAGEGSLVPTSPEAGARRCRPEVAPRR